MTPTGDRREWAELLAPRTTAGRRDRDGSIRPGLLADPCQLANLRRNLALAAETGKPVILHCRSREGEREARDALLSEVRAFGGAVRPVIHSFSGPLDYADAMLELGAVISISGLAFRGGEGARPADRPADRSAARRDRLAVPVATRARAAEHAGVGGVTAAWVADPRHGRGRSGRRWSPLRFVPARGAGVSGAEPLRPPPNRVRRRVRSEIDLEEPIQAELFSVERLEDHARSLARAQTTTTDPTHGRPVASRVAENGRVLGESYRALARAIEEERAITPAAEWLVDNFP